MKLLVEKIFENPTILLRRAGYIFQHHTENNEMSFIKPMSQSGYPRFHIYAKLEENNLKINIHLDQKKNTYGDETRHHGEYEDNPILESELERLKKVLS